MQRRTKLILLIIAALILLAIGLWILLKPFIQPAQPPELPTSVTPSGAPPVEPTIQAPRITALPQDLKQLQDLAASIVARVGSGSSGSGFLGYEDVLINATPEYQTTLKQEQKAMQQAHSRRGPAFGMLTRVVSIDSSKAVSGADVIPFILQVQQAEDAGNPAAPTKVSYKEVTVTFQKQADNTYLLSQIEWKDIDL